MAAFGLMLSEIFSRDIYAPVGEVLRESLIEPGGKIGVIRKDYGSISSVDHSVEINISDFCFILIRERRSGRRIGVKCKSIRSVLSVDRVVTVQVTESIDDFG